MRIIIIVFALVLVGCGITGKTSQDKHVGSFYDFKTPGTPMEWTCASSQTNRDDCSAAKPRDPNNTDENWVDTILNLLKRI